MPTPEPGEGRDGRGARARPDALRAVLGDPRAAPAILEKVRGKNGIPADDESPIVVNGGMQGLFAAFATLLDPGDEVLMFSPYWTPIVDLIAYHQAKAVLVPTDEARREGLAQALARRTTPRTKLLYWNSPNNPTGDVFSRARNRGGRGLRARARPRGHLRRGVRGPRLRGRAATSRSPRCPACTSARSRSSRSRRATR